MLYRGYVGFNNDAQIGGVNGRIKKTCEIEFTCLLKIRIFACLNFALECIKHPPGLTRFA